MVMIGTEFCARRTLPPSHIAMIIDPPLNFCHFDSGKHVAVTHSDDNPVTVTPKRPTYDC